MLEKHDIFLLGSEEIVGFEELSGLPVVDYAGHHEQLALLDLVAEALGPVGEHLGLEEALDQNLENGLHRRQLDVVLALGPVEAKPCALAPSQDHHRHLALANLFEALLSQSVSFILVQASRVFHELGLDEFQDRDKLLLLVVRAVLNDKVLVEVLDLVEVKLGRLVQELLLVFVAQLVVELEDVLLLVLRVQVSQTL